MMRSGHFATGLTPEFHPQVPQGGKRESASSVNLWHVWGTSSRVHTYTIRDILKIIGWMFIAVEHLQHFPQSVLYFMNTSGENNSVSYK